MEFGAFRPLLTSLLMPPLAHRLLASRQVLRECMGLAAGRFIPV